MLGGLMQMLALLSAMSPSPSSVQLEFEGAPEDTVVRCLEGCGPLTEVSQRASNFRPFEIDEPKAAIKLLLRFRDHEARTLEVVVRPGKNVVKVAMTPRS